VPGLGALDKLGNAQVSSVACAPAGNCAAGGIYTDSQGGDRGFVVLDRDGVWGKAIQVPGLAALDKGTNQPFAQVTFYPVVSCAPVGLCTAGGFYTDASNHAQAYLTQTR
jgi:hypothetical protein